MIFYLLSIIHWKYHTKTNMWQFRFYIYIYIISYFIYIYSWSFFSYNREVINYTFIMFLLKRMWNIFLRNTYFTIKFVYVMVPSIVAETVFYMWYLENGLACWLQHVAATFWRSIFWGILLWVVAIFGLKVLLSFWMSDKVTGSKRKY